MKKNRKKMKKNRSVSAITGVILMVAIVVLIASVVYVFVEDKRVNPPSETDGDIETAKSMNWSQYGDGCFLFHTEWDSINIKEHRANWYSFPATLQKTCGDHPWEDISITAYYNSKTNETHIELKEKDIVSMIKDMQNKLDTILGTLEE